MINRVTQVPCPRCNELINPHAHYCEYCGVDLAIAAAFAERDLFPISEGGFSNPISPEILVPRIGDYLRERGVLSEDDLERALQHQKVQALEGKNILVGEALVSLGIINREVLDAAVTEQILQLQSALEKANRTLEERVQERTLELQQALRRLAELSQLKSNFISNISHELRTPLTHIKGYLELLNDGELGDLDNQQQRAVDVALRSSQKLEKLIEDLLQFSLAVRGELSLKLVETDYQIILSKLEKDAAEKAAARGIRFEVNLPEEIIPVKIDTEKIEWVLNQLLDNAVKFTPPGGSVWLNVHIENGLINTVVGDTGVGIPAEKLDEIFQLFFQLDGSNTRKFQGTGLGLAFVHQIIDAHGSTISVDSQTGKGSIFKYSLPLSGARSPLTEIVGEEKM